MNIVFQNKQFNLKNALIETILFDKKTKISNGNCRQMDNEYIDDFARI